MFFYKIKVLKSYSNRDVVFVKLWSGLRLEQVVRFKWYFRLVEAKLIVEYPKSEVLVTWGKEDVVIDDVVSLKNKVTAKKRKITEVDNKLKLAKNSWQGLFPIEDDPVYIKAAAKLQQLKNELVILNNTQG